MFERVCVFCVCITHDNGYQLNQKLNLGELFNPEFLFEWVILQVPSVYTIHHGIFFAYISLNITLLITSLFSTLGHELCHG